MQFPSFSFLFGVMKAWKLLDLGYEEMKKVLHSYNMSHFQQFSSSFL